jgi:hypothetical protein
MSLLAIGNKVIGPSHLARGAECEDALQILTSQDGRWVSAVVCDGCGSARNAASGAEHAAHFLAKALLSLADRLGREGPGEWVVDQAVTLVAALREDMRAAYGPDLREYAATIVAALVCDRGGFMLHLGDGIASALTAKGGAESELTVAVQSEPQNGEYANQTFYFTEPDWIRNIRLTPISSPPTLILLATDGAQDILYRGNSLLPEQVLVMLKSALVGQQAPAVGLEHFLASEDAARISSDDKGCIIIYRPEVATQLARGTLRITPTSRPSVSQTAGSAPSGQTTMPPAQLLGQPVPFTHGLPRERARHQNIAHRRSMPRWQLLLAGCALIVTAVLALAVGVMWLSSATPVPAPSPQPAPAAAPEQSPSTAPTASERPNG